MVEVLVSYVNVASVLNFFIFIVILYGVVRYGIPAFFAKKNDESHINFDALIRLKKQELTNANIDIDGLDLKKDNAPIHRSEFLKIIEKNFSQHIDFYKKLESNSGWQEGIIQKDFLGLYPDLFQFDVQFSDVKKVLSNFSLELIHRGDYSKVLLLAWFDKLIFCLEKDLPLPKMQNTQSVSLDLSLWRWAIMSLCLEDHEWQNALFDNQFFFSKSKNQLYNTKSLLFLIKNYKLWWNRVQNIIQQMEIFLPLSSYDISQLVEKDYSKKEKLKILKRYHPDTVNWDIISSTSKMRYEALLNDNFSNLNQSLLE